MPVEGDAATAAALSVVHQAFVGKPSTVARILDTNHSAVYYRLMLIGDKPMPLHLFVRLLLALDEETARQALQEIASQLGLDVVLRSSAKVADYKTEVIEAAAACGIAFAKFNEAAADGRVTDDERREVAAAVRLAQKQLDEALMAVTQ